MVFDILSFLFNNNCTSVSKITILFAVCMKNETNRCFFYFFLADVLVVT